MPVNISQHVLGPTVLYTGTPTVACPLCGVHVQALVARTPYTCFRAAAVVVIGITMCSVLCFSPTKEYSASMAASAPAGSTSSAVWGACAVGSRAVSAGGCLREAHHTGSTPSFVKGDTPYNTKALIR